ncbi:hypothetical protein JDS79_43650, partial [Bacillus cereus]|nr:hypothetical protein [Bacillus cereus]
SYEHWYETKVEENGEDRAKAEDAKVKNRSADNKQLEEYRNILGRDVPNSLQDFQEMKYTDTKRWDQKQRQFNMFKLIDGNEKYA